MTHELIKYKPAEFYDNFYRCKKCNIIGCKL
jgi:hypothetical protein